MGYLAGWVSTLPWGLFCTHGRSSRELGSVPGVHMVLPSEADRLDDGDTHAPW